MTTHEACSTDELAPGERVLVDVGGREIGVFNIQGEFVAVANYCVHAGGPVCEGTLSGTVTASPDEWEYDWEREGEILACPWHGWEFDIHTGEHLSNPSYRLLTYEVRVEDGTVYIETGTGGNDRDESTATDD